MKPAVSHLELQGVDLTAAKELLGLNESKMTLCYFRIARHSINILDLPLKLLSYQLHSYFTKKESAEFANSLISMVGATGIEPVAPAV